MSVAYHDSAIPGRHTLTYRIRDAHRGFPVRQVDVLATPEEIAALVRDGYLVREGLLPPEEIARLRAALDETIARDRHLETQGGKSFGGVFIRHLMDKHPAFLEMLDWAPTLSIARALLGPSVEVRGFTGRVCRPDDPNQETEWHFHQRVIPDPVPPLFSRPHTLDVLLYLDDLTDLNGPLCVVPGSHRRTDRDLPTGVFDDQPGQVVLRLPAGSAVLTHGSLWHRALPTQPGGTMRRLLLFGYGPSWLKASIYGEKPKDGLTTQFLRRPDISEETRELLGVSGYM
ncbi:MAG: phytanoyl-CoA dioxygenase family protein [Armatimonadetes bacterium]|nr:phytanoyl-CoA dioxygenase family protein [Armatimonadota bacterium]